ncbi:unnamed protein product [Vicia faba]|uniref:Uncharacterized protein n=1 Tax=Vicia faba TaxID=3906 RepID=A0AAV0Z2E6_VICFA|nr:unnamed protein product [Vicia faba]
MMELKSSLKSKEFNVKMKLMNKHNTTRIQQDKTCCFFTYYKWFLWLCLSLYFFTSYLITNDPQDTSSKSNVVSHSSSTQNNLRLLKNLKVFIYELPTKYNKDWLMNESTVNSFPAIGHARALITSAIKTLSLPQPARPRFAHGSDGGSTGRSSVVKTDGGDERVADEADLKGADSAWTEGLVQ